MKPKEDGQLTGRTARRRVVRVTVPSDGFPGRAVTRADLLATEEPLGIRVDGSALTVTMRTPGDDVELAAGFLVGEAVVRSRDDIAEIRLCDGTSCAATAAMTGWETSQMSCWPREWRSVRVPGATS